jgi:hypothetical protein
LLNTHEYAGFKSPVDSQSDSTVQRRRLAGDSDDKEAKRQRQGVELSGIEMQSADNLPPQPDKIFVYADILTFIVWSVVLLLLFTSFSFLEIHGLSTRL